jgi:hypothetical protein
VKHQEKGGTNTMSETRAKYDEEFKKNAVKLSYASPKSRESGKITDRVVR